MFHGFHKLFREDDSSFVYPLYALTEEAVELSSEDATWTTIEAMT